MMLRQPQRIAISGVDGAPKGWVVASGVLDGDQIRSVSLRLITSIDALYDGAEPPRVAAIDIPIGLVDVAEVGGREADRLVRKVLGARRNSVFSAPPRAILHERDYRRALRRCRETSAESVGLSKQAHNILPRIAKVDAFLAASDGRKRTLVEAHPEVSFAAMAGDGDGLVPCAHRKRDPEGRAERLALLERAGLRETAPALDSLRGDALPLLDAIDALACLWTAARLARGVHGALPETATPDAHGLPMQIFY